MYTEMNIHINIYICKSHDSNYLNNFDKTNKIDIGQIYSIGLIVTSSQ